ncbi:MAG: hemerythrin domain-containing protein [Nanoarchaeota archaeon]|nr:hemerythrin domain-containing protein [Nanoarchaeota archaeon]
METTSSKPINILMDEHIEIMKVVDSFIEEAESLKNGKELDKEFFKKAIDFIKNYADKFHHAKEEDILFKEFCKKESELHCNPVEQMLYEHDLGRGFVKKIQEGIDNNDKNLVIENSINYAELLKQHIFKEDSILYPMADEVLDEKMKNKILSRFKDIEKQNKLKIKKYLEFAKIQEKNRR